MRNWNVVGQRRNIPAFVLLSLLDEQRSGCDGDHLLVEPGVAERIKIFEELIRLASQCHQCRPVQEKGRSASAAGGEISRVQGKTKQWKCVAGNRNSLASSGYASSGLRSPPSSSSTQDEEEEERRIERHLFCRPEQMHRFSSSSEEEETDCIRFSDLLQDENKAEGDGQIVPVQEVSI